jgi:hypothetical protein
MLFSSSLERPICKRCGIRIVLARISPDAQSETWYYECPKCEGVLAEQRPIPIDPMKTAEGWPPASCARQSKAASVGGLFHFDATLSTPTTTRVIPFSRRSDS